MVGNGDNVIIYTLLDNSVTKPMHTANMKVITSIYLKCRPDLRDEWLTGAEVDDAQDALVGE